jgi:hypothetical protein
MFYTITIISTLFMTSALHSMEIITQNKDIKKKFPYPINQKLLLIQKIYQKNNLPEDIINYIQEYSIALNNRDFQNSTDKFIIKWNDFRIPTTYYPLLTPKHISLLKELLTVQPYEYQLQTLCSCGRPEKIEFEYYLKSKKDYELFLTLPIELRKCLALLPSSAINKLARSSTQKVNPIINSTQIICVECKTINWKMHEKFGFWYYECHRLPIIPEEK